MTIVNSRLTVTQKMKGSESFSCIDFEQFLLQVNDVIYLAFSVSVGVKSRRGQ